MQQGVYLRFGGRKIYSADKKTLDNGIYAPAGALVIGLLGAGWNGRIFVIMFKYI